jgi:hypothetical protein
MRITYSVLVSVTLVNQHAMRMCRIVICHLVMKSEFSRQTFEKYSNIIFHENPFSGSPAVPYGRTDRRTDMMMLIVAYCNFAKATKTVILF